jgi:hypothetical protein
MNETSLVRLKKYIYGVLERIVNEIYKNTWRSPRHQKRATFSQSSTPTSAKLSLGPAAQPPYRPNYSVRFRSLQIYEQDYKTIYIRYANGNANRLFDAIRDTWYNIKRYEFNTLPAARKVPPIRPINTILTTRANTCSASVRVDRSQVERDRYRPHAWSSLVRLHWKQWS